MVSDQIWNNHWKVECKHLYLLSYKWSLYIHTQWIFQLSRLLTIERASPSLSPSSLFMLMDWPYSVVRSFRSLCRAHILCPAAGQNNIKYNINIYFIQECINCTAPKKNKQGNYSVPSALSWAQAAREAARRGTILLLEAKLSLKSSRQVTKSMEGQDKIQRSDSKSLGPEERHKKAQWHKPSLYVSV